MKTRVGFQGENIEHKGIEQMFLSLAFDLET